MTTACAAAGGMLAIRGMCKRFGAVTAVDDVTFSVASGSFLGLVGPNGAGKSTLLSMAVGLLEPDHGNAWVGGRPVWPADRADEAKRLLGVAPDGLALPTRLTGRELLTYVGLLRAMPAALVAARVDELLVALDLDHAARTMIGDYSTGMRKKIGLAAAVLHGPRVLVLDEPFEGVDPVSAMIVRAILLGFVRAGGTVVMSSHAMALVEQLCDHVVVLDHGRLRRQGPLDEVRGEVSLDEAFARIVGARPSPVGLSWFAC